MSPAGSATKPETTNPARVEVTAVMVALAMSAGTVAFAQFAPSDEKYGVVGLHVGLPSDVYGVASTTAPVLLAAEPTTISSENEALTGFHATPSTEYQTEYAEPQVVETATGHWGPIPRSQSLAASTLSSAGAPATGCQVCPSVDDHSSSRVSASRLPFQATTEPVPIPSYPGWLSAGKAVAVMSCHSRADHKSEYFGVAAGAVGRCVAISSVPAMARTSAAASPATATSFGIRRSRVPARGRSIHRVGP